MNSRCAIAAWLECFQEKQVGVGMNRSARGGKCKLFERSNGLDTALYKTIPLPYLYYMRAMCARTCERMYTYVHANLYAHVFAGACAYACACVRECVCVCGE